MPRCRHKSNGRTDRRGQELREGQLLMTDMTRCRADGQIHYLTPNMRCCGAGTAADTE
jgi:hypothetical protein